MMAKLGQESKSLEMLMLRLAWICALVFFGEMSFAQEEEKADKNKEKGKWGEIHGNVQFDAQYYNPDSAIGAQPVPEKLLMNGFTNLIYTKGNFTAGVRYENYMNPMLGFDQRYKGHGIAYRFASFDNDFLSITAGHFYEQFGSGMILRAYEERALGFDNVLDGARVKARLLGGIRLKALIGKQRLYWEMGEGLVRAFDAEIDFNETFKALEEKDLRVTIGGSFVSKYQEDTDPDFELPENVGSYAIRGGVRYRKWFLSAEYVHKDNDPQATNTIFHEGTERRNFSSGSAFLGTLTYSQKGLGVAVSAKRTDNMDFRSDRGAAGFDLNINYLPALTQQHTYQLSGSLYPYATQPNGEWAYQLDIDYRIPKNTVLGGKRGMGLRFNYSEIHGLKTKVTPEGSGLISEPFGFGDLYFRDINFEVQKTVSSKFKFIAQYLNIAYNKDVVEGLAGYGTLFTNIGIIDMTYKIAPRHALRMELQGLWVKDRADLGDWAMALLEYTWSPHLFVAVMNQWNYGNKDAAMRHHYPSVFVGYVHNASRVTLGYGRQRAGILCVGGICRTIPASNGVSLTVTTSF